MTMKLDGSTTAVIYLNTILETLVDTHRRLRIVLIARKSIQPDEEITFDYSGKSNGTTSPPPRQYFSMCRCPLYCQLVLQRNANIYLRSIHHLILSFMLAIEILKDLPSKCLSNGWSCHSWISSVMRVPVNMLKSIFPPLLLNLSLTMMFKGKVHGPASNNSSSSWFSAITGLWSLRGDPYDLSELWSLTLKEAKRVSFHMNTDFSGWTQHNFTSNLREYDFRWWKNYFFSPYRTVFERPYL